jgi:hypothetical protein
MNCVTLLASNTEGAYYYSNPNLTASVLTMNCVTLLASNTEGAYYCSNSNLTASVLTMNCVTLLASNTEGAYYYLYGAQDADCDYMAHGPMDKVFLNLVASWKELDLPVRSIQLDDWWYQGNEADSHDHMCVKELAPKPDLFPTGLPKLPPNISYVVCVVRFSTEFALEDAIGSHACSFEALACV